jgi:subtilisin family serine protease
MGSAPGAQWIACKGYQDGGTATMEAFTECGEFMVCPTDEQGNNADCTKTVHVTSNSWGVWPGTDYFEDILQVHHSVGIIPLFSNGNEGPECGDMLAPADSAFAIGVGATGSRDELASWSSRGPSRYGVMKPDISAPGMSIRSADCKGDTLYATMSGTSMFKVQIQNLSLLLQ